VSDRESIGKAWRLREYPFPTEADPVCLVAEFYEDATGWTPKFAIDPESAQGAFLNAGSVATAALAAGSVTEEKLANWARATVDVTAGAPGSVALVGTAQGIASVSLVTLTAPVNPYRVARFTFATAMPDTNYVVAPPTHEYTAGVNALPMLGRSFLVVTKTTTYFEIGMGNSVPTYTHVDEYTHRFSVLVMRG
jgi:hypothetical protein